MMGARYWTECDLCRLDGLHTVSDDALTNNERKKQDRRSGWARVRRHGKIIDVCPSCAVNVAVAKVKAEAAGGGQ